MTDAFICDATRTPIGRFGGALSTVRADDLAAHPLKSLIARNADMDWTAVDEVIAGPPTRLAKIIVISPAWLYCWPGCRKACRG